jgi:hypothetical protein
MRVFDLVIGDVVMPDYHVRIDELVKSTLNAAFEGSSVALSLSLAAQLVTLQVLLDELVKNQQISGETAHNIVERISLAISSVNFGGHQTGAPLYQELNRHRDHLRDIASKFKLAAASADHTKQ